MMVSSLGINGVSNLNWQQNLTQATKWMTANSVNAIDLTFGSTVGTVTYSCGTTTTDIGVLPLYLRPVTRS
jgi:hypothetical protein